MAHDMAKNNQGEKHGSKSTDVRQLNYCSESTKGGRQASRNTAFDDGGEGEKIEELIMPCKKIGIANAKERQQAKCGKSFHANENSSL